MKLSVGSFCSCRSLLNGCVAVFALANTAAAQTEVDALALGGRMIPVYISSREVRAQPAAQFVMTEAYTPASSEPGTIRRTPGPSDFHAESYIQGSSSSNVAFSRKRASKQYCFYSEIEDAAHALRVPKSIRISYTRVGV